MQTTTTIGLDIANTTDPVQDGRIHIELITRHFLNAGGKERTGRLGVKRANPVVECVVSWDRPFDQPVPLPSGGAARTLRDAANYIKEMPRSQRDKPEWRLVIQMLIDAAEDTVPMLFAKWAILYAVEQSFNPVVKDPCGRRRKLMRYR